ncbi:MAG TPA: hypothetical protein DCS07_03235 [Bdellovibrionales bacterium]|nr:MAG: hypothetical protein A2Z97_06965 [Bdellovibrionales bacterium GWB1_52_6]OFZ05453.1 MAG: hypothetical protein A2X97_11285 [Bdellovibrionales bacterium GWA1_52_35]OFZ36286.1 MAG: hypothetical protein A2070_12475 [Bdellovibrionales bacterium GWC1_52_8]HAR41635.1 hypothetical protein [Bdellovibrionales bacterium]HCM39184.1 hypothetical protein [Bdellovibrionales bacterium]
MLVLERYRKLMKRLLALFGCTVPVLLSFSFALAGSTVHHQIHINLDPQTHRLQVEDILSIPREMIGRENTVRFRLHDGLNPTSRTPGVEVRQLSSPTQEEPLASVYELFFPEGVEGAALSYEGQIFHPLKPPGEEYERAFSDTPGIISEEGIYLANASAWYPRFGDELLTFSLDVQLPAGWKAVSQGTRTMQDQSRSIWISHEPQDEMYLIGAKFTEYHRKGAVAGSGSSFETYAFLRTPDPELANQYLDVTGRYIEMYNSLIGKYPYSKFALIENFWETGYGMPSFTLLGPQVIRFPFIINSSYPHEILHNWWGNGVYVDYSAGNWCEGITAYLADHLIKEQEGGGAEYRRVTLQKYTDYVNEGNDFPLSQFLDRHSAATEAIGYGKSLMYYHMLRTQIGDELFRQGIRKFYAESQFRKVRFADFNAALSSVSNKNLSREHHQWVEKKGAPELRITAAQSSEKLLGGFELRATIEQLQPGDGFDLQVPVAIHMVGKPEAFQTRVAVSGRQTEFILDLPARPFLLDVDPEFDLFRKLNRFEIPPSLSQSFGAKKALVLIPAAASTEERASFEALAKSWAGAVEEGGTFEILLDSEISELPSDRGIWVLGWNNRFAGAMLKGLEDYDLSVSAEQIRVGTTEYPKKDHSLVVSVRNPKNASLTVSWVAANPVAAIPGLDRKLPHYGKYSFLVFEGSEPKNVAKGVWPAVHSPLSFAITQPDGTTMVGSKGRLASRKALVEPIGIFSASRMQERVQILASEQFKGRELGTPELDQVAGWIAEQFRRFGLQAGGDSDFFQKWNERLSAPKGDTLLRNIVGFIPGKNPEFAGQSVILGAHYDHLGLGWPDAHSGNGGKIHYGADDNASGVAVLLELARYYGDKFQDGVRPERSIIFVAFTGEEAGLLGSRYFAANGISGRYLPSKMFAMLNLDTVGRLGTNKLLILGGGSAREWSQIMTGVGHVTGVPLQVVTTQIASSDQKSFSDIGIPAIQLFSGANGDYHRPSDMPDKIDSEGMAKVARVTQETLDYLTSRKEALTSGAGGGGGGGGSGERKVYLGTVPDFAFSGEGMRVDSVAPGSPAEKAGLQAGDVIVQMNTQVIRSLKEYSDFLKTLHGGDTVTIKIQRNGIFLQLLATVIER